MKRLSDDELIFNAQKVSEHGTPHLLSFARTSKDHARICKLPTVLKTLPSDFVDLLNNDRVTPYQSNYLNMMIKSGHPDYCIQRALSLMYDIEPNVVEAIRVLNIASAAVSTVSSVISKALSILAHFFMFLVKSGVFIF